MGIYNAHWITAAEDYGQAAVYFRTEQKLKGRVRQATLWISARGVYEAELNGKKVGNFYLAPGWTSYDKRIQYQQYDVTELITKPELELQVTVGNGWYAGRIAFGAFQLPAPALIASLEILYADGTKEELVTDGSNWKAAHGPVLLSDIYDGETYDARIIPAEWKKVIRQRAYKNVLIPQEGEILCEQQHFRPIEVIHTPDGKTVLDFGQNLVGYVQFEAEGKPGEEIELSFSEIINEDGTLNTQSYVTSKNHILYICGDHPETYHPHFTYWGFRYCRIDKWPEGVDFEGKIQGVAVHSDMKRTGWFSCSEPMVNTLFENVIWGQRGNFLDVPTDCPQRDERMGWMGDAVAFCKTASYNFDVERFFRKWMRDVMAEQYPIGNVPDIVPKTWEGAINSSAGWGDGLVICPWQMYMTYGDVRTLREHYSSMCRWIEYVKSQGTREELWDTGIHYGDWLAYDSPDGYKGNTSYYLIATVFYYYSTTLVCKAGDVLGEDTSAYQDLAERIKKAFYETYLKPDGTLLSDTQTAYALVLGMGMAEGELRKQFADRLAQKVRENDNMLNTGFLGTRWLLYALSENGYQELAVTLLLQKKCPSWLNPITRGATTVWENWDGQDRHINSFNHYSYGAVVSFLYEKLCGIEPMEAGFRKIRLAPYPDKRLDYAEASIQTRYGMVRSGWKKRDNEWQYQFEIPAGCEAEICLGNNVTKCGPGVFEFYSHIED